MANKNRKRLSPAERATMFHGLPLQTYLYLEAKGDIGPPEPRRRRRRRRWGKGAKPVAPPKPVQPEADKDQDNAKDGTWLDEDIRLVGEAGQALLRSVFAVLDAHPVWTWPRRKDQRANSERRVECIVANALRAHFYRVSERVAYHRGSNVYLGRGTWLSAPSMRDAVDRMARAGLIGAERGIWEKAQKGNEPGVSSTYWLAEPLLEMVRATGTNEHNVGKSTPHRGSLIRLRAGEDIEGNKPDLRFEANEETDRWAADLDRYNRFSELFEVGLVGLTVAQEDAFIAGYNRKQDKRSRQPAIRMPEYFNRYLKRIFNDGTFDHGGR